MKKTYQVTERAGARVAGLRVPESGKIDLTDKQAEHELRQGTIAMWVPKKARPKQKD